VLCYCYCEEGGEGGGAGEGEREGVRLGRERKRKKMKGMTWHDSMLIWSAVIDIMLDLLLVWLSYY